MVKRPKRRTECFKTGRLLGNKDLVDFLPKEMNHSLIIDTAADKQNMVCGNLFDKFVKLLGHHIGQSGYDGGL